MPAAHDFDAVFYSINRARDFNTRIDQRLATFARCFQREFFRAVLHDLGGFAKHLNALFYREPVLSVFVQSIGSRKRSIYRFAIAGIDRGDEFAIEWRSDFVFADSFGAGDQHFEMFSHDISCYLKNKSETVEHRETQSKTNNLC